jgi:hypothetical protein
MYNKYSLLPPKISVIEVKNKIRIYFAIISKNKKACSIYLQKLNFKNSHLYCAQLQVSNKV